VFISFLYDATTARAVGRPRIRLVPVQGYERDASSGGDLKPRKPLCFVEAAGDRQANARPCAKRSRGVYGAWYSKLASWPFLQVDSFFEISKLT
jgi:hypothetical protein